ncbi:glycosyltransferase family 2 protein [Flavobacteriales bacterium]|nr:glycosyltransferase family 2 protein [Flavobacteriales bacterium]
MKQLSVVICTYNRSELLGYCLESLEKQAASKNDYEVIVVDNNSTDETQAVSKRFEKEGFKVVIEEQQGLSYARNRGAYEATTPWLFYLDDDVLLDDDVIERALDLSKRDDIGSFGGSFSPWFHYGQPHWFGKHYASIDLQYNHAMPLPDGEFLTGCVFAIRKTLLKEAGMFNPELGMRGKLVGYGEETEVQRILRNAGHVIWYDPNIHVRHVVNPERLSPLWHIQSGWAHGRDRVYSGISKGGFAYLSVILFVSFTMLCIFGTVNGMKLLFLKKYYPENWFIDTFRKVLKRLAIVYYNLIPSQ